MPTLLDRFRWATRGWMYPPRQGAWEYLLSDYGYGSTAGVSVSEYSALRYSPVWAGVSILSRDIAKLPLVLYKNLPNGGKERFATHPLYRVLHDEPNPEMTSYKFRETMQALCVLWGNSFAEIVRDQAGRPRGMYPIAPYRVSVQRAQGSGRLFYRVQNPSGRQQDLEARDMIHLSSLSLDGIIGEKITQHGAESIGLGIAAESFGAAFFGNGATFGGVVQYPMPLTDEKKKSIRESIEAVHRGVERAHRVLVLGGDAKWAERGTNPNDAQFLETRQFQVREVARWLGMPPHKLSDLADAHFTNIEEQEIDYHQNTLAGWLQMWEQELRRKLIAPLEYSQQTIAHVMNGVMRGNSTQRADFYGKMFAIGALSVNDILRLEDMNPIGEAGNVHMVPLNMIPIERYNEWIDAQLAPKPAPPALPPAPDEDEDEDEDEEALEEEDRALAELRAQVATLTDRAEQHAERAAALEAVVATTKEQALERALEVARERQAADDTRHELAGKAALLERLEGELAAERARRESAEAIAQTQAAAVLDLQAARAQQDAAARDLAAELERRGLEVSQAAEALAAAQIVREEVERSLAAAMARAEQLSSNLSNAEIRVAEVADLEGLLAATRAREAELENQVAAERRWRASMVLAIRESLADAYGRMARVEVERIRKRSANPQTLQRWSAAFYDEHGRSACADILRPAVKAFLAWTKSDADPATTAQGLADAYCDRSVAQLTAIVDGLEGEEFAAALQRLLNAWEHTRPDQAAEKVVIDAIAHE